MSNSPIPSNNNNNTNNNNNNNNNSSSNDNTNTNTNNNNISSNPINNNNNNNNNTPTSIENTNNIETTTITSPSPFENFQCLLSLSKDPKTSLMKANNFSQTDIINISQIGLTPYETVCSPRLILSENKVKFTKPQIERVINEMLRCSICYDIFNDPVNLKKCLHKFCKKCIGDYNRKIKKECTICRNHIETRRLMKEDEKIKQIIECIIPNIEKFKKTEDNILLYQIKGCYFKDEERFKQQMEKTKKEDEKEEKELKNKYKKNHILQNIFPNTEIEVNEKNNKEEKFFINKKRCTEVTSE